MRINLDRSTIALIVLFIVGYIATRVMYAQLKDENTKLQAKCRVYELCLEKGAEKIKEERHVQVETLRMALESCTNQMTVGAAKRLTEVVDGFERIYAAREAKASEIKDKDVKIGRASCRERV